MNRPYAYVTNGHIEPVNSAVGNSSSGAVIGTGEPTECEADGNDSYYSLLRKELEEDGICDSDSGRCGAEWEDCKILVPNGEDY